MKKNRELLFIEYSLKSYQRTFIEIASRGFRNFLIIAIDKISIKFLGEIDSLNCEDLNIYICDEEFRKCSTNKFSFNLYRYNDKESRRKIEVIFIFIKNKAELSMRLLEYAKWDQCIIVCPITAHYFKERPLLIESVPKSGTHMLFEYAKAFGYNNPPSLNLPGIDTELLPGHFYNLQHMSMDYLSLQYHNIGGFINSFCNSAIVFIYRDPRDVAISMAHYLANQKEYHILSEYMLSLSIEDRIKAVILGNYPIPIYLNDHLLFNGNIRDLLLLYANWIKYPFSNTILVRYEDLVGLQGGAGETARINSVWLMQLALQVPGNPRDYAERVYAKKTMTFRKGKIENYKEEFKETHYQLFAKIPQDFMELYGYGDSVTNSNMLSQNHFKGYISFNYSVPLVMKRNYKNFNIVLYNDSYYAISMDLGNVDLLTVEQNTLQSYIDAGKCFIGTTLSLAKGFVDEIFEDENSSDYKGFKSAPDLQSLPQLLKEHKGYNIVAYNGMHYGVEQSLGEIDWAKMDFSQYPQIIKANSVDEIEKMIDIKVAGGEDTNQINYLKEKMDNLMEISAENDFKINLLMEKVDNVAARLSSTINQNDQKIKDDYINNLEKSLAKKDTEIKHLKERERELFNWIDHIQSELVKVKSGKRV